jgi:hypothetical protein
MVFSSNVVELPCAKRKSDGNCTGFQGGHFDNPHLQRINLRKPLYSDHSLQQ